MVRYCLPAVLVIALTISTGCKEKGPPRAPVFGTIRFQGKPLAGAEVAFIPVERGARSATSTTDEQGNYRLTTLGLGEGALIGKHKVSVSLRGAPVPHHSESNLPAEMRRGQPGKPLIPIKYFNPEQSGLTANVADVSENRFDFDLTP